MKGAKPGWFSDAKSTAALLPIARAGISICSAFENDRGTQPKYADILSDGGKSVR